MDPFIGQIMMFGGNFAPRGWANCDGQLLSISSNTSLFSILGTTYGGDGKSTFALPDLRGRAPIHEGTGPGLSTRSLGSKGGEQTVTLTSAQMPAHRHGFRCAAERGNSDDPAGMFNAKTRATTDDLYGPSGAATMNADIVNETGGSGAHDNMMPYLTVTYVIALQGIYPSRN